jgi:hypothetical protein
MDDLVPLQSQWNLVEEKEARKRKRKSECVMKVMKEKDRQPLLSSIIEMIKIAFRRTACQVKWSIKMM